MKSKIRLVQLVAMALTSISFGASADQLSEFQKAADSGAKGCDSIPFSSIQERCRDKRDDVDGYCKTDESGCRELNTYARQQELQQADSKLNDLDRARQEARSKRDSSTDTSEKSRWENEVSQIERAIDEQKRSRETIAKTIEDYKYQAQGRIEKAKRCREARIDAVELFDEAQDKVKEAESNPDLKPFVPTLLAKYEDAERGHTIAIKETQERLLLCEKAARSESF